MDISDEDFDMLTNDTDLKNEDDIEDFEDFETFYGLNNLDDDGELQELFF